MNLKALAGKVPHRIKGTLSKDGYAVSEGVAEAQDVLKKAKEIGVSFTAYIAGVLAYSIEKLAKQVAHRSDDTRQFACALSLENHAKLCHFRENNPCSERV